MPPSGPKILRRPIDLDPGRMASRIGSWEGPALLEGGPGLGIPGRWSILAARPRRVFESSEGQGFRWSGGSLDLGSDRDVLEGLAVIAAEYGLGDPGDHPESDPAPFQGGLIGYLGYDLAPSLERLPRQAAPDSRLPSVRFGLYDTFVLVDHQSGSSELWAVDLLGEGPERLEERWNHWRSDLVVPERNRPVPVLGPARPDRARPEYLEAARKVLDYIQAGDIYQANLSQRFVARGLVDPLGLYLRLKAISPAPFATFLAWDDLALVGSSPELFYQSESDRIATRPIKGTRPRSLDPEEDARLAEDLVSSMKDRAELTMIVDLERNDLGRVCQFGSVRVAEPWKVESFEEVHHLVATIEGRLRPGIGPVDVIRSVFPGGSITGAPKIRAMQIIDELEPNRRSAYTGAVGYLSRGGRVAFNIAIRTILVEGDRVSFQVGGGIVADSDPESEYAETLHKARGMLRALQNYREAR
ncbi:aminodeoxychorismate synthase component I [Tundrisphaera lichenicola]|uniref:aminodeoxychorismate synthase component I n=1 Tax=Tundrisphaera lichenicola TaxID=2029860 RepID=UPI003EB90A3D